MATQNVGFQMLRSAAAGALLMAAGALAAIAAQRHAMETMRQRVEELEEQARAQQRSNLAWQQRQHWELLSKAMDDPDLTEVLDIYDTPVSPQRRRQYLFANALYTNLLCYHRIGNLTREEFFQHVRAMFQNPVVREYWYATRHLRASLTGTEEAELGALVDHLLLQLEEADTDEWWVVGEPPPADE
ncbi:DUF6082 family protein [Streptomyces thermospinosisporus]|uniref:DUF6082 family protein n=1 Tax=Streptomyces thermospinosisporus TaxID=161482 RepID=A0ABN1Z2L8_9ACTN